MNNVLEDLYESNVRAYISEMEECERAFEYWNEMEMKLKDRERLIAGLMVEMNQ